MDLSLKLLLRENGLVLSRDFLVYWNPGLHFGDIHVLKARYVKDLESVFGNAKCCIFFSRKGPRSVSDEVAGGDFDGDLYWISRNTQVVSAPATARSSTCRTRKLLSRRRGRLRRRRLGGEDC